MVTEAWPFVTFFKDSLLSYGYLTSDQHRYAALALRERIVDLKDERAEKSITDTAYEERPGLPIVLKNCMLTVWRHWSNLPNTVV